MNSRQIRIAFTGVFLLALLALVLTLFGQDPAPEETVDDVAAPAAEDKAADTGLPPPPVERVITHRVASGQTFGAIGEQYGMRGIPAIVAATKGKANLEKIRPGEVLEITQLGDKAIRFRYEIDRDNTLVVELTDPIQVKVETETYDRELVTIHLNIDSSLWQAGKAEGFSAAKIMEMAKIFENEVDFNVDIRPGAKMSVVVESLSKEGQFVRFGDLHAAWFQNRGKQWTAVSYTGSKGETEWYDKNGELMHPSVVVVKSVPEGFGPPFKYGDYLKYQRKSRSRPLKKGDLYITADFYQPRCKGKCRHSALDFRAAVGTPVLAIGSGTVRALTNPRGLCGNGVQLEMKDEKGQSWRVLYCHLSKIKVKKKQKVKRGQLVGLSGGQPGAYGAGNTTGPHLHMELRAKSKKGSYRMLDPLPHLSWGDFTLMGRFSKGKKPKQKKRRPKLVPPKPLLKTDEREAFVAQRDKLVPMLGIPYSADG
jgi:murein DD-endopeptidase MepM/ murein hydrolase activator NlpD